MNNLFNVLEWNQVKKQFEFFARTDLGIKKIHNSYWITDNTFLEKQLSYIKDARSEIDVNNSPEFIGISDISEILHFVKIHRTLSIKELFLIKKYLFGIKQLINYYKQRVTSFDDLKDLFLKLPNLDDLFVIIDKCIDDEGEIRSDASKELYTLKTKQKSIEKMINDSLTKFIDNNRQYLAATNIVYRNNRACLPILITYKNHFNGIIHAQSASGQTIYLEPQHVLNLNNSYEKVLLDITTEIEKIAQKLTESIVPFYQILFDSLDDVAEIDFAFLKAAWMVENHGCLAELNQEYFEFINAGHPLINKKTLVCNNILIDQARMVLITGPNTGGKSVFLKTFSLIILMTYFGFPVFCQSAKLKFVSKLLIDLGDQQSINDSLSTFSAHLKQINYILENMDSNSVVILDEIGSATDPSEGSALAIAIMEKILATNAISIITTHYQQLKTFALNNRGILMASMEFDQKTMLPTYKFLAGVAGQSYALDIAKSLNLDADVIKRAITIKHENQSDKQIKIEELEVKLNAVALLEKQLQQQNQELEQTKTEYQQLVVNFNLNKDNLLEKYRTDLFLNSQKLLKEGQLIIEEMKNHHNLADVQNNQQQLVNIINEFNDDTYADEIANQKIEEGAIVKIISTNQIGNVVKLEKKKAIILVNNFEVSVNLDNIVVTKDKVVSKKKETKKRISLHTVSSFNSECMLVGLRFEEAKSQLLAYIDQCILNRLNTGRIVHGHGSGVLRKMVHDVLKKQKNVASYNLAMPQEGGSGVTIVVFK